MPPFFHISKNVNPPGCHNAQVPHEHDHHEILFCVDGAGAQLFEYQEYSLNAGDMFFFPAGTRHCSIFLPNKSFECYVVGFQNEIFSLASAGDKEVLNIVEKMRLLHGKVALSGAAQPLIEFVLKKLLSEHQRKQNAYLAGIKMVCTELFVAIARDPRFEEEGEEICLPPSDERMVREIIDYMESYYMGPVSVDTVLEFCPLSRTRLHSVFKEITGFTLIQYLTSIRVKRAKELLTSTDMPIGNISRSTGFCSPAYFGQVFKKEAGVSPGEYRNTRLLN